MKFTKFEIIITILIFIILIYILVGLFHHKTPYYRLDSLQVDSMLDNNKFVCEELSSCDLQSGDILFRRHITENLRGFNMLFRPYFTHTAYYIGDNQVVEARGDQKNPNDEIAISDIYNTDWLDRDIEKIVVVRPNYPDGTEPRVSKQLVDIANDNTYTFGFASENNHKHTCAQMIARVFKDSRLVGGPIMYNYSPDLLFKSI